MGSARCAVVRSDSAGARGRSIHRVRPENCRLRPRLSLRSRSSCFRAPRLRWLREAAAAALGPGRPPHSVWTPGFPGRPALCLAAGFSEDFVLTLQRPRLYCVLAGQSSYFVGFIAPYIKGQGLTPLEGVFCIPPSHLPTKRLATPRAPLGQQFEFFRSRGT